MMGSARTEPILRANFLAGNAKPPEQKQGVRIYQRGGGLRGIAKFQMRVSRSASGWGYSSMVDHLVRAGAMRDRAKRCETFASQTKSEKFADCYRLLSQNYNILATVEEERFTREMERARAASANHMRRAAASISG